jgi:O-antigen/teichoic acid export membrane protein
VSITNRLKARLPSTPFWRQLTLVAGGTAAGQALSIVASPILSRLYGPSDFGILAIYTSITSIAAVVSSLSYHQAIPLAEDDDEAAKLLVLALGVVVTFSGVVGLLAFLTRNHVDALVPVAGFGPYLALVPLGVLGLGTYEVLTQWAARQKAFGLIGRTSAARTFLQVGMQVASGWAKLGTAGLMVGQLLGQCSGTLQIGRAAWRKDSQRLAQLSLSNVKALAIRHRRYPLLSAPGALLSSLDSNATPLLFAHFFGATITGYFALGHRLLAIPFFLVGTSAQRVFAPAAAAARREGRLAQETELTYRRILMLVLPMVLLLVVSAPELFSVVLGTKWHEAGVFMQWLSLRTCFTLLVFPLVPLLYVMDKQGVGTAFSGAQFLVRVGAIYAGSRLADARMAVALLGACTGAMWLAYLAYLLSISGVPLTRAAAHFARETLVPALLVVPVLAVKLSGASALMVTLTAGLAGACAFGNVVRRLRAEGRRLPREQGAS